MKNMVGGGHTRRKLASSRSLPDATGGLGYETALGLAQAGAGAEVLAAPVETPRRALERRLRESSTSDFECRY